MSDTAQPARYDLPWKAALAHAFRSFMEFYFPDFSASIDWKRRPRCRDKELAEFGIGAAANVMVADKLFEVCMRNGHAQQVLIHIEIQAQRDAALARRVHDYNYRIGKAHGWPVLSFVVLADTDPRWRPSRFRQQFRGVGRIFSFNTAKLLDYRADPDALAASHNPIAWVTLVHLCAQQAHRDPPTLFADKLRLTRVLFQHRWSGRRIMVLFNVINWMMVLPEPHQRRYWQVVLKFGKEHDMKLLNPLEQMFLNDGVQIGLKQGRQEGKQEGKQEGLTQGRKEGAAMLLERQLAQRFGPLPQTTRKRLARATESQIEAWSDALASAESLKQVFASSQ
ncbi:hypothetical protein GTP45_10105 [Pseudoduganella sp. FT55W]|uniref:DUF4351 domain-containing protein n=1 Tax=Duganella rivi TaxID=2666083 RepID=A0A7X4GPD4_9BURK|nr:DUF4351 domain-containing protein [Duganella rivi]MYM67183.1 hypothetical protein [Duganella rivi]